MKITEQQLDAALLAMDSPQMARLLKDIMGRLYAEHGDDLTYDDECHGAGWDADTTTNIAEDMALAGLSPESIALRFSEGGKA